MNSKITEITFNTYAVQQEPEVSLHYAEINSGGREKNLIIFLHGFGEYWYGWHEILPAFAKSGYHVVAPDLRGFNKSSKPLGVKNYDIKYLVNDVVELIKSFKKDKVIVVGHDWGGAITWDLAEQFPELLSSVVVLNSPHRGAYAKNIRKSFLVNLKQSLRSWYIYFFQLPFLPEIALRAFNFKWAEYNFRGWAIDKNAFSQERIDNYKDKMRIPGALTAGLNYYRANTVGDYGKDIIKAFFGLKKFSKIKVPTLLIWAENDMALEKALTFGMEEFFEARFEVKYIEKCSHWVHIERPNEVISYILTFIDG